jgi:hypothetical protein
VLEVDIDLVACVQGQRDSRQRLSNSQRSAPERDDRTLRDGFPNAIAYRTRDGAGFLRKAEVVAQFIDERKVRRAWQHIDEQQVNPLPDVTGAAAKVALAGVRTVLVARA